MEPQLEAFLKQRGVPEEDLQRMNINKVDCKLLLDMSDSDLSEYLPVYGDRLAVKSFCRQTTGAKSDTSKRANMLKRLREKIYRKRIGSDNESDDESAKGKKKAYLSGNKFASKAIRRIELGWIHKEGKGHKQIRAKTGGGTRHLSVEKSITANALLHVAESLFFPDGKSMRGSLKNFDTSLLDFKQQPLDTTCTVESFYERSKMRLLRFYLCTEDKDSGSYSDELPDIFTTSSIRKTSSTTQATTSTVPSTSGAKTTEESAVFTPGIVGINVDTPLGDESWSESFHLSRLDSDTEIQFGPIEVSDTPLTVLLNGAAKTLGTTDAGSSTTAENSLNSLYIPEATSVSAPIIESGTERAITTDSDFWTEPVCPGPDDTGIHFEVRTDMSNELHSQNIVNLCVHRGNSLMELISAFKDPSVLTADITAVMILPNGVEEHRSGDGVFKDCLAEFWTEFYDQCCIGSTVKVPVVRHDFQQEEWTAIARILYKGWQQAHYFPVQLSSVLLEEAMYGHHYSDLTNVFTNFVSPDDRRVLEQALNDFDNTDGDDLLDVLENHKCRIHVKKDTLPCIVSEIAHKELVQEPKYIIDCWSAVLQDLAVVISPQEMHQMYMDLVPTAKKVNSSLSLENEPSDRERATMNHLRRFIREMNQEQLRLFLRFCTGSDLMVQEDKIKVRFVKLEGLSRRPVAHTCGKLLELPTEYENYAVFRSEFNNVLKSNVWVMD